MDGYIREALNAVEPDLTARTRVIALTRVIVRSEWLGFPPFVARIDRMGETGVSACGAALLALGRTDPEAAETEREQLGRAFRATGAG